jgi:hypothetical protein
MVILKFMLISFPSLIRFCESFFQFWTADEKEKIEKSHLGGQNESCYERFRDFA